MALSNSDETYYTLLKVNKSASLTEVIAAYHSLKNTFSKNNMATYSLFDNAHSKQIIDKLEEAYQTLSNVEKRKKYDRMLAGETTSPTKEIDKQLIDATPEETGAQTDTSLTTLKLNGAELIKLREERSLSLADVARITKIPIKFLAAIEEDNFKKMPARVYLQGFLKNLATLYKFSPTLVLPYIDWVQSKEI